MPMTWAPMMDRNGRPVLDGNNKPVMTRQHSRVDGTRPQMRPDARTRHNPPGMPQTPVEGGGGNRFKDHPPIPNPSMLPRGGDPTGAHPPTRQMPAPQPATAAPPSMRAPQAGGPGEMPSQDSVGLPGPVDPYMIQQQQFLPMLMALLEGNKSLDPNPGVSQRPQNATVGGSILPWLSGLFGGK